SSAKRNVLVRRLSARGTVVGAFTEVAKDLKVGLDLDLAVTSDRVVVAYSESGEGRPTIMSATLDHQGHIKAPASRLTPPRGEQSLVRLLAVGRDVAAIWEEPRHGRVGHRELFVGYLNEQGRSTFPEYRLSVEGHGPLLPQLQATQKGVVA